MCVCLVGGRGGGWGEGGEVGGGGGRGEGGGVLDDKEITASYSLFWEC